MKSPKFLLNLPATGLLALFIFAGHFALLSLFGRLSSVEFLILFLCTFAQSMALFCFFVLAAGSFSERWSAAFAWSLAVTAASLLLWDNLSYRWIGLHLDDTIPFLYWSTVTTFRAIERKRWAVFFGLGTLGMLALTAAFALVHWHKTPINRLARRRPFAIGCLVALALLALGEFSFPKTLANNTTERRRRILPLLPLLIPEKPALVTHRSSFIQTLPADGQVKEILQGLHAPEGASLPDIYLFVIESLRGDYIVPEIAPNLSRFGKGSLGSAKAAAAANCTHVSWFSILHSRLPIFWSAIAHQPDHPFQSIPIAALRRAGYQFRVIATPNLNYYAIGDTLFGPDRSLASEISDQSTHLREGKKGIADLDRSVMNRVLKTLDHLPGPTLHLVFLDSTHHDYAWPTNFDPPFKPYLPQTSLLQVTLTAEEIPLVKNRYKNALAYVDSLFGEFLQKRTKANRPSIVAVTGDHGEEFFEEGHLTHASELNRYQLQVPVFISVPGKTALVPVAPVSHLDIFPTVLDAVGIFQNVAPLLDGQSLLNPDAGRSAISAQCSNYTPYRYLIDAGAHKALLEFESIAKIGHNIMGKDPAITHHLGEDFQDLEPPLPLHPSLFSGVSRLVPGWEQTLPIETANLK